MSFHGCVPDNSETDITKIYTVSAVLSAETDPATVTKENISLTGASSGAPMTITEVCYNLYDNSVSATIKPGAYHENYYNLTLNGETYLCKTIAENEIIRNTVSLKSVAQGENGTTVYVYNPTFSDVTVTVTGASDSDIIAEDTLFIKAETTGSVYFDGITESVLTWTVQ